MDLGTTKACNAIQKNLVENYIDMIDENIIEIEYSTLDIVDLVEEVYISHTITKDDCDEEDDGFKVDRNNI